MHIPIRSGSMSCAIFTPRVLRVRSFPYTILIYTEQVHRDLKPENLLLKSMQDGHELKVADFGFAAHTTNNSLATQCGTPNYVAPEILQNQQYGCAVDMWSVGVLTFVLLGANPGHTALSNGHA